MIRLPSPRAFASNKWSAAGGGMRRPRFRSYSSRFVTRAFADGALGCGSGFGAGAAALNSRWISPMFTLKSLIEQLPSVSAAATAAAMHLVLMCLGC